jgi:diamine N-acetyltransferase
MTATPSRGALAVRVRRGVPADAAMLADLGARTFQETFAADNRPEDMAAHLASTFARDLQARELADPARSYLIAEVDGQVAGYALLHHGAAPACAELARPVELARFYVDRPWHGLGVARDLMAAVEREALDRGGNDLWLGVWERNLRAIAFYEKCGFRDVGSQTFQLGGDTQHDRVMVHALAAGRAREGSETLYDLLAGAARRATDAQLAFACGAGLLGIGGIALLRPGWWVVALPLMCVASFGAWGIADRERGAGGRGGAALAAVRVIAAAVGTAAAVAIGGVVMAKVIGTWIS